MKLSIQSVLLLLAIAFVSSVAAKGPIVTNKVEFTITQGDKELGKVVIGLYVPPPAHLSNLNNLKTTRCNFTGG